MNNPRNPAQKVKKENKERLNLFVGGLKVETTQDTIRSYFEKFGPIEDVNLIIDWVTNKSKRCAIVFCRDKQTVSKILKVKNHKIEKKKVRVTRADKKKKGTKIIKTTKVFIGNIAQFVSKADMTDHFSTYGKIVKIVISDAGGEKNTKHAIIEFDKEKEAKKLLDCRDELMIKGCKMTCSPFKSDKHSYLGSLLTEERKKKGEKRLKEKKSKLKAKKETSQPLPPKTAQTPFAYPQMDHRVQEQQHLSDYQPQNYQAYCPEYNSHYPQGEFYNPQQNYQAYQPYQPPAQGYYPAHNAPMQPPVDQSQHYYSKKGFNPAFQSNNGYDTFNEYSSSQQHGISEAVNFSNAWDDLSSPERRMEQNVALAFECTNYGFREFPNKENSHLARFAGDLKGLSSSPSSSEELEDKTSEDLEEEKLLMEACLRY
jgi:RNA recognition motif-containing protein